MKKYLSKTIIKRSKFEIWPEHSLIDKEQKGVGEFFYFKNFFMGTSNTTRYTNFSIVELDRSIKR